MRRGLWRQIGFFFREEGRVSEFVGKSLTLGPSKRVFHFKSSFNFTIMGIGYSISYYNLFPRALFLGEGFLVLTAHQKQNEIEPFSSPQSIT